jgi:hypothetical protein
MFLTVDVVGYKVDVFVVDFLKIDVFKLDVLDSDIIIIFFENVNSFPKVIALSGSKEQCSCLIFQAAKRKHFVSPYRNLNN